METAGRSTPPRGSLRRSPRTLLTLAFDVEGLPCLVVGGGRIGTRKALTLLDHGATVSVLAPALSTRLRMEACSGRLRWLPAEFAAGATTGYRLVVAATDSARVNAAIADEAAKQGTPCCNVSDRGRTRVLFPACSRVGEVTVAIHTGGTDCRRSRRLSKAAAAWLEAQQQDRPAAPAGMGGPSLKLVSSPAASAPPAGLVLLVGAGPGAPDLLTLRGLHALQRADVIIQDDLLPEDYVEHLPVDMSRTRLIRLGSGAARESQAEIGVMLVRLAGAGLVVARLKGGDPGVFGRLEEELSALYEAGIPVEVVPGTTAGLAAACAAGLPATRRGQGRSVALATARTADGGGVPELPRADTLLLYMGVAATREIQGRLLASGWAPETPCRIFERATQRFERVLDACLERLPELCTAMGVRSPALLMVGIGATSVGDSACHPRILCFGNNPQPYRCLGHVLHWPASHPDFPERLAPAEVALFQRPDEVDAICLRLAREDLPSHIWCEGDSTLDAALRRGLPAVAPPPLALARPRGPDRRHDAVTRLLKNDGLDVGSGHG